ncbi:MAG: hypothetical protein CM1200mP4_4850 [Rhodospirillaceae bacterium]|nr:MAG: hypothetical protein CM1200mP4_4850 [Rhodospirillaceae bacterium]
MAERRTSFSWSLRGPFCSKNKPTIPSQNLSAKKTRDIVADPKTADLLCPDNVLGCKRLCVDTGYYEVYNQEHVDLVDISEAPIDRFTPNGLVAGDQEYCFDAIICATGFAAMTGSFDKISITGRNGLSLLKKWEAGPRAYLGLASAGFPEFIYDYWSRQPLSPGKYDPSH